MIRCMLALAAVVVAAPALACDMPRDAERMAKATIAGVNDQRAGQNLPPVTLDTRLTDAAQAHACDSAARNRMGHDGSDGSTLGDRARRAGYDYRAIAENVALGYPGPAAVLRGWMGSTGHRRNILLRGAEDAGIGMAVGRDGSLHWVLVIGRD
ncbi:MAG: hypothetical protein RL216_907 [Pseudomonadota bacterium]